TAADLEAAAGWTLTPEGLCQGDICVPIPPARADEFAHDGAVNVAALWRHLGRAAVHSRDGSYWLLGDSAADRGQQLQSLEAPDFTLPDLAGTMHSLSEHRGKKVVLASWASW
ncbi:MAG: hypothetical protein QOD83_4945, partial [Solirubrobacteraceae bacterium]|nr:hypothetical protein [Solirubrobacteraceae bacterium]